MTSSTITRTGTLVAAAGIGLATLTGLSACSTGEDRSEDNFCSTIDEHRDQFNSSMDAVTSSPDLSAGLSNASDAFAGLGDMWTKLAKVAPEDIRKDAETMDEAFGSDSAHATETESSGGIFSGISDAVDTARAATNIGTYADQHCR